MTHIILVRHGHVAGITPERFRGRMELESTDLGLTQARTRAQYIARQWRPTSVYTSPMGRCVPTGREIAYTCGAPVRMLPELNDLDYGAWQGKTHDEVRQSCPDEYLLWRRAPELARTNQISGQARVLPHRKGDVFRTR
jgi:phosphoserine phosphatase